jgi:hypothetical protein
LPVLLDRDPVPRLSVQEKGVTKLVDMVDMVDLSKNFKDVIEYMQEEVLDPDLTKVLQHTLREWSLQRYD